MEQVKERKKTLDHRSYVVVRRVPDQGLAIVETPDGDLELWERVNEYEGETLEINGEAHRFLRHWKGKRN